MAESSLEALVGSMSLSELSQRSGKSVGQIVDWALGNRSFGKRPAAAAAAPSAGGGAKAKNSSGGGGGGKGVNTRTPNGRDAYDQAVLGAVQGSKGPIGAGLLRKRVGGTALQVRTALNRLIEAGKINYQGRARATAYTAR